MREEQRKEPRLERIDDYTFAEQLLIFVIPANNLFKLSDDLIGGQVL
jgi:hypothetical protein